MKCIAQTDVENLFGRYPSDWGEFFTLKKDSEMEASERCYPVNKILTHFAVLCSEKK